MNRLPRAALLVSLVEALIEQDSWCGGTHVQKATFFLQELLDVPLDFTFTLYKYGPYSFDLNDELAALRADEFLQLYARDPQYGPSYALGNLADQLKERFPKTLTRYQNRVEYVAETLGECGVAELERLATALYVRKRKGGSKPKEIAKTITNLKPHISFEAALEAVQQVNELYNEAEQLRE